MTNEEYIRILKVAIDNSREHISFCFDGIGIKALEMAIKALEEQPITWIVGKDNCQVAVRNMPIDKMQKICAIIGEEEQQPCEDAINRDDAIELIAGADETDGNEPVFSGKQIIKMLKSLPSVNPSYNGVKTELESCEDWKFYYKHGYAQAKRDLEQTRNEVLDKIRAEIKKLDGKYVIGDYGIYGENSPKYVRLWEVLQIIDKYKTESEEV